ncbi:unnamed protein product, partial [Iphiclides podalirius]
MSLQKSGYHIILLVTGCDEDKNKKKHLKFGGRWRTGAGNRRVVVPPVMHSTFSSKYFPKTFVLTCRVERVDYTVLTATLKRMTSPALKKSPEHQKISNKSPTRSTTERPQPTEPVASTSASTSEQPEAFSFLRIFKLADLMMKQGC